MPATNTYAQYTSLLLLYPFSLCLIHSITTRNVLPSAVAAPKAGWEERKKEKKKTIEEEKGKKEVFKTIPWKQRQSKGRLQCECTMAQGRYRTGNATESSPFNTKTYQQENTDIFLYDLYRPLYISWAPQTLQNVWPPSPFFTQWTKLKNGLQKLSYFWFLIWNLKLI